MEPVRTFTSSPLSPYDRGVEFGERHAAEVARSVEDYRRLFLARALQPFDVDHWSDRAWHAISALAPEAAQEIRGLADGARIDVRHLAGINARTELLAIANPTGVDECSTVVSLAAGRAPLAVQTWDWYDAMADNWLHWTIPHPDGRVVHTVTEYGVLGKIGVNGNGVGVLFNMLHHVNDAGRPNGNGADGNGADGNGPDGTGADEKRIGYPLHLLSRHILDTAETFDDALALAHSVQPSASSSLTVVASSGQTASVEMFPGGPGLVEPDDGLLVRTNHFVSAAGRDGCLAAGIGPGSAIRRDTLLGSLQGRELSAADEIIDAMHDHADQHGGFGGVCAHPDPSMDPVLQHGTLATVVVDAERGTLQVAPGGPCASGVPMAADAG